MFRRRTRPSAIVIRPDQRLPPSASIRRSDDEWMPDTDTDLTREKSMTDVDENARYSDPAPADVAAPDVPRAPMAFEDSLVRDLCPHCRGTGKVLTDNDLLRESLALLGDHGDAVVREFYINLFDLAPDLAALFPADLLREDTIKGQRDKLLKALASLAQLYDPARSEQMGVLDTHLQSFGRMHASFNRPDGSVRGATLDEYHAVKVVLFNTLHAAAGEAWRPEYDDVWSQAYDYAAAAMLFHGQRSGFKSARYRRL
jgi:hemoglobin-like flavoprotein